MMREVQQPCFHQWKDVGHAETRVQQNTDRRSHVLRFKVGNLLLDTILVDAKIFRGQPGNKAASRVLYGRKDIDELHIDTERFLSFSDLRKQERKNCGAKDPA